MNLGLGTLSELKSWLLAEELRVDASWDAQITAIGRGVAAMMERFCSRKFERVVGAVCDLPGDRAVYVLERYPVEVISKIEIKEGVGSDWVDISSSIESWSPSSGIVDLGTAQGSCISRMRITWTGGYWFDTTEDGSSVMPAGCDLVPADLKLAWLQHCGATWAKHPKLGTPVNTVSQSTAQVVMNFSPDVLEVLQSYRRMSLS